MGGVSRRDVLKTGAGALWALLGRGRRASASHIAPLPRTVRTVRGEIKPEDLGIALTHEHLLLQHPTIPGDEVLEDREVAAGELGLFMSHGLQEGTHRTLVELTAYGFRGPAHADNLRYIGERTGVQIVMGTGFHKREWHPSHLARRSQQEVEDLLSSDILEGVGPARIKAGIIGEIGISDGGGDITSMDREELKVLRASACAQRRTGAARTLHFDNSWGKPCLNWAWRIIVLEYPRDEEGIDLQRVIVSHLSPLEVDLVLHRRIITLGAYVSFDSWGWDVHRGAIPEETYRSYALAIKRLIDDARCLVKALLSHDGSPPSLQQGGMWVWSSHS
jgi:5-phospho-D-xylono-1,4-lactonase